MSRRINTKALLVFFLGFSLVSVVLLGVGFVLLPELFSVQEVQVESIAVEDRSVQKEPEPAKLPNVTFINQAKDGVSMEVRCQDATHPVRLDATR